MKYTSLKNDIVNILHSSDYDLILKFYDEDGRNTLDTEKSEWCYISNYNIMVKFMNDENSVIQLWKDKNTLDENMKHIIQRIRELSGLNGVQVQIRIYDDLNQRKIYNLIKRDIIKRTDIQWVYHCYYYIVIMHSLLFFKILDILFIPIHPFSYN